MEINILIWINEHLHGSGFINQLFKFITYLGEDGIAWLILAVILLCFKKTRKCGVLLILGVGAITVSNHFILKNIINRPRPFAEEQSFLQFFESIKLTPPTSSSFPSGHTAVSIMCATILTMCFRGKGAWSFIPAVLISLSRIFLCVHYPTDVLGGMVEGAIVGVLVALIGSWILNKLTNWWLTRKTKNSAGDTDNNNSESANAYNTNAENPNAENPKAETINTETLNPKNSSNANELNTGDKGELSTAENSKPQHKSKRVK